MPFHETSEGSSIQQDLPHPQQTKHNEAFVACERISRYLVYAFLLVGQEVCSKINKPDTIWKIHKAKSGNLFDYIGKFIWCDLLHWPPTGGNTMQAGERCNQHS